MADVRLIIDPPLPGPRNMAVDEVLLADAVENGVATLRFYRWSEPTLSLGYFQQYEDRNQHAASRGCAVVRRQSGGGAILHDRELTYSLAVPPGHALARDASDLYDRVHKAFIAAIMGDQSSGMSPPSMLRLRGEATEPPTSSEPFLCFQRQSPGDVILSTGGGKNDNASPASTGPSATGWKVLGSAQRRHRGAILQHGSLLVEASSAAPELPGLRNLYGPKWDSADLTSAICDKIAAALDLVLIPTQLPGNLESKAAELTISKYRSAAWTKRR